MFTVTRRHVNRNRTHVLARVTAPVVGGNKGADMAYLQVYQGDQCYGLEMTMQEAQELSLRLQAVVLKAGSREGWVNVP